MQEPLDMLVDTLYTGLLAHRPNVYVNPATSSSGEHDITELWPYL
jgi:hypothetical protein